MRSGINCSLACTTPKLYIGRAGGLGVRLGQGCAHTILRDDFFKACFSPINIYK